MRTVVLAASALICALSLDAQITATVNQLPDGRTEIRMRNDGAVALEAFAISVNYKPRSFAGSPTPTVYVDPAIDAVGTADSQMQPLTRDPIGPHQEFIWVPMMRLSTGRKADQPVFDSPITAGIFADGATTGDPALLTRLMLRRSNMLLAVETTLEALSDAGRRNISRERLIEQFKKMVASAQRWYLLPEQQIGVGVYQSMIGKLINLPEVELGSPFPPSAFVAQETAALRRHRLTLMESQPSLAELAMIGR